MNAKVSGPVLDQLFRDARSFSKWLDRPIDDATLRELYQLTSFGPTSANCSPGRFVFVRSAEQKERLAQHMFDMNKEKTRCAPVTVIIGQDKVFFDKMHYLCPHAPQMAEMLRTSPPFAQITALRNSTLQGAYLIIAARALGLDAGPMSGFDHAGVDAAFFPEGTVQSNFICCLGYGERSSLHPRLPRLAFEEACRTL